MQAHAKAETVSQCFFPSQIVQIAFDFMLLFHHKTQGHVTKDELTKTHN